MFGKKTDSTQSAPGPRDRHASPAGTHSIDPRARGGVSFGAILTGVVVAFGAMFLLSALVGGILVTLGLIDTDVTQAEAVDVGLGAGIALVAAQLLAYLWGGYTAGRMARGSGLANGLLVPLTALVVGLIVAGIATALGASANLNLPFTTNRLPLENDTLVDWGLGIGIASVVAMFLGGGLGGGLGARWHTKLERHAAEEELQGDDRVDVRDHDPAPAAAATAPRDTSTSAPPAPVGDPVARSGGSEPTSTPRN